MEQVNEVFDFVKAVLNLFKAVPKLEEKNFSEYTLDNEKNLAEGFFVTEEAFKFCPPVADEKILSFIKEKFGQNIFELNRGFYKSFATVAASSQEKILANKLLHYMSTYGLESFGLFDRELVYIPNDALELPEDAKPIKIFVVNALDDAEIKSRAVKMIQSGAALSKETLDDLAAVIKFLGIELNFDDVPNKEFAIRLFKLLNILPDDPVQFLRFMIYDLTGSTLLIKDKDTIFRLCYSDYSYVDVDEKFSRYISKNGLAKLAGVFHRFKPLWLAFKPHSDYMRATINKMRKLADRHHKPLTPKLLERLTSAEKISLDELKAELANVTVFKKVSLANALLYRSAAPESIVYNIRNGKAFAEDFHGGLKFDAQKILDAIVGSIVEDLSPNVSGKKIFIPDRFTYAVPVSEKKFIGNIPYGSSYAFEKNSVVLGVHWFNLVIDGKEERVDLDLHLNSEKRDLGWQNDFDDKNFFDSRERKVIFSGDMTDAPIAGGGATEAFFVGEKLTDETLMLNLNNYTYGRSDRGVPFKLILADVAQEKIDRKYLLDAHEIGFCVPSEISSGEMFLGFLLSDESGAKKFYFFSRSTGERIVARSDELTGKVTSAMLTTFKSCLSLNELLRAAGAVLDDVTADDCEINLDPAEVTKDTLLGLFAK
ncbi:MAG: hypothetical protein IKO05_05785 [Selenomonadaceae bacterium]|nr:hypothetical protein [Selenomonadaceae bacterium]